MLDTQPVMTWYRRGEYILDDGSGGTVRKSCLRIHCERPTHRATQHLVADWQASNQVHVQACPSPPWGLEHTSILKKNVSSNEHCGFFFEDQQKSAYTSVCTLIRCESKQSCVLLSLTVAVLTGYHRVLNRVEQSSRGVRHHQPKLWCHDRLWSNRRNVF